MKELKAKPSKSNLADPLEQGQRILANIIANAYLRSKKDSHTEMKLGNTNDKEV